MKSYVFALLIALSSCVSEKNQQQNAEKVIVNISEDKNITKESGFAQKLKTMSIPEKYTLEEVIIGDKDAKHTLIVYTSFSCSHCKKFHDLTWPNLKKKYVSTGVVKVYLRQFLDDIGALESAILTRYFAKDDAVTTEKLYNAIFSTQGSWLKTDDPRGFLKNIFVKNGYSLSEVNNAIADKAVSAGLMKKQQEALFKHDIDFAPAFIVDGKVHKGAISLRQLEEMIGE